MLNCTATYLCSCDGRASNEHRPHRGMRVAASLVEQKIPYSMCHFHLVPNTSSFHISNAGSFVQNVRKHEF